MVLHKHMGEAHMSKAIKVLIITVALGNLEVTHLVRALIIMIGQDISLEVYYLARLIFSNSTLLLMGFMCLNHIKLFLLVAFRLLVVLDYCRRE